MICDEVEITEQIVAPVESAPHAYPRPAYSEKFRCLARACDENCCNGWSIPIDERTLAAYLHHPTLKPFTEKLVVIDTRSPVPSNVAQMPLTHAGTCAFLNEEKLCGIHAHFGPSLLSNACATYPREVSHHAGHSEAALNLSCPEAARLTLLDPSLLGSGPWQAFGARRYTHIPHASRLPESFDPILALREFTLLVVSDPTYPLWQRLHILGDLAQRLEMLCGGDARRWARQNPGPIAALLDETTDAVAFHTLSFPAISPGTESQLRFTAEVLRKRLAAPPVPERFLATVQAFQSGLGCEPAHKGELADAQVVHGFQSAYRYHARPLLDRHPHLIENFLVNHIFKYGYPFGRSQDANTPASPTGSHLALVANLALTQTMLVGLAAHHRDQLAPEHAVRLIQSLSKAIEHRAASATHLTRVLEERSLTSPVAQAQLLYQG